MASQRATFLNQDVLTQIDGLVALQAAARQDRPIREVVRYRQLLGLSSDFVLTIFTLGHRQLTQIC